MLNYVTLGLVRLVSAVTLPAPCSSVCLSTGIYQGGSHWTKLFEMLFWGIKWKINEKFQVCSNRTKYLST
jgi:hypothetical protein